MKRLARHADDVLFFLALTLMLAGVVGYNPSGALSAFDLYVLGFTGLVASQVIDERYERRKLELRVAELERKRTDA